MSKQLFGVGEEAQGKVALLASSVSPDNMCQSGSYIKEHNYLGLSDCSSVDSSTISTESEENNCSLNLKATDLRLGLPGSLSPGRDPNQCLMTSAKLGEKSLFPLHPSKDGDYFLSQKPVASGNKRGFSDAMDGFAEGNFLSNSEANVMLSPQPSLNSFLKSGLKGDPRSHFYKINDSVHQNKAEERPVTANDTDANCSNAAKNISNVPATKAQVVGWPPIRSFRKNTLASNFKNNDEVDGKAGPGALFVKVSMDGAPYLRKVDLRTYSAYQELSSALEKMFIVGQYGSHGAPGKEMLSEIKLKDLMNGSEYVLTYEDKDGDWMLLGDVPWEMFIETCKKLRIMKSSDAIGLGYANKPRYVDDHAIEKTHL